MGHDQGRLAVATAHAMPTPVRSHRLEGLLNPRSVALVGASSATTSRPCRSTSCAHLLSMACSTW